MTEEEYKKAQKEIEKEKNEQLHKLRSKFVEENKKFSVGDIIRNQYTIIRVDKISYSTWYSDLPKVAYIGCELTKKLSERKDGSVSHLSGDSLELVVKNVPT